MRSRRVVLIGTPGPLANGVTAALAAHNTALAGVITIGSPPEVPAANSLPVAQEDHLATIAADAGIAVEWCTHAHEPALLRVIHRFNATLVVVACMAIRLSPAALASTTEGFWNVHPSLLPKHRGPAPMFWQLRTGADEGGVSIHRMDASFDTGPIGSQAPVALPAGITEPSAEHAAGLVGGALIAELLRSKTLRWQQQDANGASYESQPTASAYRFSKHWPLLRAWRFLRGVRWRGQPFHFLSENQCWMVRDAVDMMPGRILSKVQQVTDRLWDLPLADGVLRARQ